MKYLLFACRHESIELGPEDKAKIGPLEEAIEVAGKHPVARFGTLELRVLAE